MGQEAVKVWVMSEIRIDFEIWSWFKEGKHDKDHFINYMLTIPGVAEVKFGYTGFVRFNAMNEPSVVQECARLVKSSLMEYIGNV